MIISRTAVANFLDRDFDDYRWMKKLTREKIMRELSAMRVKPRFKTEPWLHQLVCFYIGLCNPHFLFLLDMGTGKTKILADLMTQLLRERRIERALIGVPRLINIDSWEDDLAKHSDLEFWPVDVVDIDEKRELLLEPKGEVTVIDYQSLTLALCRKGKKGLEWDEKLVKRARRLYDFVGMDESHKLANHNGLWWTVMHQLTKFAPYRYGSTGTLFGKNVEDLWGQFALVDGGETFGEHLGLFRASFFTTKMNQWSGIKYIYNPRMDHQLHAMLAHKSLRYEEHEVQDLPKRVSRVALCDMTPEQEAHYKRALEGLINANGKLGDIDAGWLRMRQISSGYLAWKDEHGDHVLPFKRNPKMEQLERLLDEMGDSKIVICYDYTETGRLITEKVKEMGLGFEWYYGGTKDKSGSRRRFMTDPKCRVFIMNSEAGGTGNDGLQGVARYMVFYESPCPPITRQQTEKRLHRAGQQKRVFIYDLIMQRSLDKGILDSIKEGVNCHERVVNGRLPAKKFFLASHEG